MMTRNPDLSYRRREYTDDDVFSVSNSFPASNIKEDYIMRSQNAANNLSNVYFSDNPNQLLINDRNSAKNHGLPSFTRNVNVLSGNVAYVQPMRQIISSPVSVEQTRYVADDDVHFITGGTYTRYLSNYDEIENLKDQTNIYSDDKVNRNSSSALNSGLTNENGIDAKIFNEYDKTEEIRRLKEQNNYLRSNIYSLNKMQPETDDDFEEIIEETTTTTRKIPKDTANAFAPPTLHFENIKTRHSIGVGECDVNQYFILDTGSDSINPDSFPRSYWERLSNYFSSQFHYSEKNASTDFRPHYSSLQHCLAPVATFLAKPLSYKSFGVNVKPMSFPMGTSTDYFVEVGARTSEISCMTDDLDEYFARLLRSLAPECPNADAAFIRNLYRYSQSNCSEFIRRLSYKLNEISRQSRIDEPRRHARTDSIGVSMRPMMSDKRTSSMPPNCYSLGINTELLISRSRGSMHAPKPVEQSSIGCSTSSFIKNINRDTQCSPTSFVQELPKKTLSSRNDDLSVDTHGNLRRVTEYTTKFYRTKQVNRMSEDESDRTGMSKTIETFGGLESSNSSNGTLDSFKKNIELENIRSPSRSENIYIGTWDTNSESSQRSGQLYSPKINQRQVPVMPEPNNDSSGYRNKEIENRNSYVQSRLDHWHSSPVPEINSSNLLFSSDSYKLSSSTLSDDTTINSNANPSIVVQSTSNRCLSQSGETSSQSRTTNKHVQQVGNPQFNLPVHINFDERQFSNHLQNENSDQAAILSDFLSSMCKRSADNRIPLLPNVVKIPSRNYSLNLSVNLITAFESVGRWCASGGTYGYISKELQDHLVNVHTKWFDEMSRSDIDVKKAEDLFAFIYNSSPEMLYMFIRLPYFTGATCLHFAVGHGAWRVVSLILDTNYANPDQTNDCGFSPVMIAAASNSITDETLGILDRLFTIGNVNTTARTKSREAPLLMSVKKASLTVVQCLLNHDANINYQDASGNTALMCAVEWGKLEIVQLLLSRHDIRTDLKDMNGKTALDIAERRKEKEIINLLLKSGHDRDSVGNIGMRNQTRHVTSHIFRRGGSASNSQESTFSVVGRSSAQ